ncbi:MAG: peptidylprolyl isomerase [Planctomycetota bacterium]
MRYFILVPVYFLLFYFSLNAQDNSSFSSGRIVARVNNDIITSREVSRRAIIINQSNQIALQTLLEDKLITRQAIKDSIKVSDEELEREFQERLSNFGSLDAFLENIIQPLGISLEDFRNELKEQLLRDKYIRSKIGSYKLTGDTKADFIIDIVVSPKEMREYFETNKERFAKSERIKTRQIILKVSESRAVAETKELAERIVNQLEKGDDFDKLARQYSDIKAENGGLWDWAERGSFIPELEKIIYSLKIGEISPAIITDKNIIIVKIEDKITSQSDFATPEIQEEIKRILVNQKIRQGAEVIKEKLLKEASIQIEKD